MLCQINIDQIIQFRKSLNLTGAVATARVHCTLNKCDLNHMVCGNGNPVYESVARSFPPR